MESLIGLFDLTLKYFEGTSSVSHINNPYAFERNISTGVTTAH